MVDTMAQGNQEKSSQSKLMRFVHSGSMQSPRPLGDQSPGYSAAPHEWGLQAGFSQRRFVARTPSCPGGGRQSLAVWFSGEKNLLEHTKNDAIHRVYDEWCPGTARQLRTSTLASLSFPNELRQSGFIRVAGHSLLGDNRGHQFVRRYVKGGVRHLHPSRCNLLPQHMRHFS